MKKLQLFESKRSSALRCVYPDARRHRIQVERESTFTISKTSQTNPKEHFIRLSAQSILFLPHRTYASTHMSDTCQTVPVLVKVFPAPRMQCVRNEVLFDEYRDQKNFLRYHKIQFSMDLSEPYSSQ